MQLKKSSLSVFIALFLFSNASFGTEVLLTSDQLAALVKLAKLGANSAKTPPQKAVVNDLIATALGSETLHRANERDAQEHFIKLRSSVKPLYFESKSISQPLTREMSFDRG